MTDPPHQPLQTDDFGALRSALQGPAEARTWARALTPLRALWHADPARFEREHLPYIEGRVRGWPPGLRVLPITWLAPGDHMTSPAMRLFDALSNPMPLAWFLESHVPLIPPTRETLPPRDLGQRSGSRSPRALPAGVREAIQAAAHLTLRHLCLHDDAAPRLLGPLLDNPAARLERLELSARAHHDALLGPLAAWPGLSGLRALALHNMSLTDASLARLLPHLGALRALELHGNLHLTDASLRAILTGCPDLTALDLRECALSAEAPALLHDLAPETLRHLAISPRALRTDGALALATARFAPHLQRLVLTTDEATPEAAALLTALPCPDLHTRLGPRARTADAMTTTAALRACHDLLGLRAPSRARRDALVASLRAGIEGQR